MNKNIISTILILTVVCVSCPSYATDRIIPHKDLSYDGAFLPPTGTRNGTNYGYSSFGGMGWNPDLGGLIVMGASNDKPLKAEEIIPPAIVKSSTKNTDDLNHAAVSQAFTDLTGGIQTGPPTGTTLSDAQYLPQQRGQTSDKYYYSIYIDYDNSPSVGQSRIGWCETDLTALNTQGLWRFDNEMNRKYDQYLLAINTTWADNHVDGKYLGAGRYRTGGSWGPTLYATAPWEDNEGDPPAANAQIAYEELIYYPSDHVMQSRSYADPETGTDAIWITIGTKQAFVVARTTAYRTLSGSKWWSSSMKAESEAYHNLCSDRSNTMQDMVDYNSNAGGISGAPYMMMLLFYDVDQIAEIAAGTRESWDIQPYAYYSLDSIGYESGAENQSTSGRINGIAYDAINQKIYVSEYAGYSPGEPWPLYHVFSLANTGSTIDTTAPPPPANVAVNGSGVVTWDASTDDQGGAITYVIFKWYENICGIPELDEYRPVRSSLKTIWTDPLYSAGDQYKVVAYDQSMNASDGSTDSIDTGDSGDSTDTGDSGDSTDTGDSGDSTDTGDSGDSTDTGDSGDSTGSVVKNVTNLSELYAAFSNEQGGDEIVIAPGTYILTSTALEINAPNIIVRGATGNRDDVVILGDAMTPGASIKYIFLIIDDDTDNLTIKNLSLGRCGWHAISFAGQNNAGEGSTLENLRIIDTYEQMVKVTDTDADSTDNVTVKNCLFEYTAGFGPQYYIGGIDAHRSTGWIVQDNIFRYITSPNYSVSEHAVHIWDGSAFSGSNIIERNKIIDCDRGIGIWNSTGTDIIRNNMIYHSGSGAYADVGIDVQSSPNTTVYNNTIYMNSSYANAIEYNGLLANNVLIVNNLTNKAITSRNGANGTVQNNVINAQSSWFINYSIGDLHLSSSVATVVDQGQAVAGLSKDFDGQVRPQGEGVDIGADEITSSVLSPPATPENVIILSTN